MRLEEAMTRADARAVLEQKVIHVYRMAYTWCIRTDEEGPPYSPSYVVERLYTAQPKPHIHGRELMKGCVRI